MKKQVKRLFDERNGILSTAELKEANLCYEAIQRLLIEGEIERIRRGYYQRVSERSFSDIPTLSRLFSDAVICLESALDYYGYTDRTPSGWHLAVPFKSARARFSIDYPIVKPHFIRESKYPIGIETVLIDGTEILSYNRERTSCDLLLHKNKIDAEVFNTAIQRYVRDPAKMETRLLQYATALRVERKAREIVGTCL